MKEIMLLSYGGAVLLVLALSFWFWWPLLVYSWRYWFG